jgi:hypothetical protein
MQEIDHKDKIKFITKKYGFLQLPVKISRDDNPTVLQAKAFAKFEESQSFSLQDHIHYKTYAEEFQYTNGQWMKVWETYETHYGTKTVLEHGIPFDEPGYVHERIEKLFSLSDQEFYQKWLLNEHELPLHFPIHEGQRIHSHDLAGQLLKLARNNPTEFRNRLILKTPELNQIHHNAPFGIVEKEINVEGNPWVYCANKFGSGYWKL